MFKKRFDRLNSSQKEACSHLYGPLLVVAGPGSGKTELLSLRIANILNETDTLPQNILCLTFTDAATKNLQKRLFDLIGTDSLKVGIFTFHGFVNSIYSKYSDRFSESKNLNEVKAQSVLFDLMSKHVLSNKLCVRNGEDFVFFHTVYNYIQDFKKSGITPKDLLLKLKSNYESFISLEPLFESIFGERLSKKRLDEIYSKVSNFDFLDEEYSRYIKKHLLKSLRTDIENEETKGLQLFKARFLAKDENKNLILKVKNSSDKIKDLAFLFQEFQNEIKAQNLSTFDDLILDFLELLKSDKDFLLEVAESFNFIMVDEFQDTNLAQMQILELLTSADNFEKKPNIMVVGDDDQSIYKFQGASVSNILLFNNLYEDVKTVVLNLNYRSTSQVVNLSQTLLSNLQQRISNIYEDVSKNLEAFFEEKEGTVKYFTTNTLDAECKYIADQIEDFIKDGHSSNEIAVITRKNKDLKKLALYLDTKNINYNLSLSKNIFELKFVEVFLDFVNLLFDYCKKDRNFDSKFLKFLMLNTNGDSNLELWKISKIMKKNKIPLDEAFLESDDLEIKNYLFSFVLLSHEFQDKPFIRVFYNLLKTRRNDFFNQIFSEYFGDYSSNIMLESLQALKLLDSEIVNFYQLENYSLVEVSRFINIVKELKYSLKLPVLFKTEAKGINLITSHGSKGLEFETVFIMNCNEVNWNKNKSSNLRLPECWDFLREKEDIEDNIRLFFVAMTRAKNNIYFTRHLLNNSGRELLELSFLKNFKLDEKNLNIEVSIADNVDAFERDVFSDFIINEKESDYFNNLISNWKISATSVADFLNFTEKSYFDFINHHVIKVPNETNVHMIYGTLIHGIIEDLFRDNVNFSEYSEDLLLKYFEQRIRKLPVLNFEIEDMKSKCLKVFPRIFNYFAMRTFSEINLEKFINVKLPVNDSFISLHGAIDLLNLDKKKKIVEIFDFKTGKSLKSFDYSKGDKLTKLKAFRYKLQLHFYVLLVNLRFMSAFNDFTRNPSLVFVENEDINTFELSLDFDPEFYEKLKIVIVNIHKIVTKNSPIDTSKFSDDFEGILEYFDYLSDPGLII